MADLDSANVSYGVIFARSTRRRCTRNVRFYSDSVQDIGSERNDALCQRPQQIAATNSSCVRLSALTSRHCSTMLAASDVHLFRNGGANVDPR